ncbi:MAG: Efflux ABC transporter, ATP-binding protein [uncultured Truepera sp.]|uniref:Efflux ABC transporter, ATP-binding protein n=1 Tax=uncultured Truepera sp. TaxID=543023 RepID=A0A6J4VKL2_9DEIN|nr:MAG: Efflux ABC transporter, ATP-binding protein [uncultured Truepera sp.]
MVSSSTLTTKPATTQPGPGEVAALQTVSKRYGSVTALTEVSLTLRAGEVLALLGPNGAGKTTAVSLLLGLARPDKGQVRLFGRAPQELASRVRVGVTLQLSGVPETLTVAEHLQLFASYYPHPLPLVDVLERTGLTGLERRLYGKLSGGQRQRLHLALALVGDPDLLALDEPTTGLDVGSRRALWDGVRGFIAQGKTVLLTTHYLEEADVLADRIVVLNEGRVVAEGTPAAIKERVAGRRVRFVTALPLELIQTLPGVQTVKRDGPATEVRVAEPEPLVRALLELDRTLTGLEVTGIGLEEAFLALTGQREKVAT